MVAAIVVYFGLCVGSALTNRPQVDEGLFASPALNMAEQGFLGTTVLETKGSPLIRIEERTYWVMPLYLLNAALSFKIFGFSIFSMRLVSIFWGLVALAAWFFIVQKATGNRESALLCLILMACDYTFLDAATTSRMDIMSAALTFAGYAIYLNLRENKLSTAILASQTFIVLSGLTHPNGLMGFFGLLFLTLYFDARRLRWQHIFIAASPYVVGGVGFGYYALQDPLAFKAQFIDNAIMGGRMSGFDSPFSGFTREFTERYPHAFGLGANSSGHSGPIYLKSLILIGYIVGILGVLFTKSLRQNKTIRALLIVILIHFVLMSLIDGQKETPYLIHIIPFYLALLAMWSVWAWQKRFVPPLLLAFGLLGFLGLQAGGMLLRTKQNTSASVYQPTIDYLKTNAAPEYDIMGGVELGFGLGLPKNFVGDARLGYYSGRRCKFLVLDDASFRDWEETRRGSPAVNYLPQLVKDEYQLVYKNAAYQIYERRQP